jgi:hypothetical protein
LVKWLKRNEAEGIVIELSGESALVRPVPQENAVRSFSLGKELVEMKNEINAVVGDKVIFEENEGGMLIASFIFYILPLLLTFFGAVFGYNMSEILRIKATAAAVAGGIFLLIISLIIIKLFDKSGCGGGDISWLFICNHVKYSPLVTYDHRRACFSSISNLRCQTT